MKIIICSDYNALSIKTAELVLNLVREKPNLVFCLPAGGSPIGMYEKLVESYQNQEVDFSAMITFNMDEYVGLSPDDPNSYAYFMQEHFLDYVNVAKENIYHPLTTVTNINEECRRYSQLIGAKGGLDLAITGVGDNGHIAFNEPNRFLSAKTHCVELNASTIKANSRFFGGDLNQVPTQAVSIGMEEIMKCRNFLVVASGGHKAEVLARFFAEETIDTYFPLSFLRLHQNVTFILDEAAASLIPQDSMVAYV